MQLPNTTTWFNNTRDHQLIEFGHAQIYGQKPAKSMIPTRNHAGSPGMPIERIEIDVSIRNGILRIWLGHVLIHPAD